MKPAVSTLAILGLAGMIAMPQAGREYLRVEPLEPASRGTTRHQNSLELVEFVAKILGARGHSGSLVYEGTCAQGRISDDFQLTAPSRKTPPLNALKEGFERDSRLSAKLDSGLMRVTGGNVPWDLLNLRIPSVTFQDERDPMAAVRQLLQLPVITEYTRANHIQWLNVLEGIYALPVSGGPKLPGTLQDPTLSQALDMIARTFPGMWTYRECIDEDHRTVYIGFMEFSIKHDKEAHQPNTPEFVRTARPQVSAQSLRDTQ